jgi:hypothetical protein
MAKTSGNEKTDGIVPEEVRILIGRKVALQWRKQVERYSMAMRLAYSKLTKEIVPVIGTSKPIQAYTSIPRAAFEEIAAAAVTILRNWPGIAWECIRSVLEKSQMKLWSSDELGNIFNECAWGEDQKRFIHCAAELKSFKETYGHILHGYGLQRQTLDRDSGFKRELDLTAARARADIHNIGRIASEEIAITIDEYVIAQKARQAGVVKATTGDSSEAPLAQVEASSPTAAASKQCEIFRSMKNLTFDELHIAFVGDKSESGLGSNNMLEISARHQSRRVALGELNLVDKRRGSLNGQAAILLGMAKRYSPPLNEKNSTKMARLRNVLRINFGIEGDPFDPPHKNGGWMPRFRITDRRGLADERARDEAERRMTHLEQRSYSSAVPTAVHDSEDPSGTELESGEDWLRDNDPHYRE